MNKATRVGSRDSMLDGHVCGIYRLDPPYLGTQHVLISTVLCETAVFPCTQHGKTGWSDIVMIDPTSDEQALAELGYTVTQELPPPAPVIKSFKETQQLCLPKKQ